MIRGQVGQRRSQDLLSGLRPIYSRIADMGYSPLRATTLAESTALFLTVLSGLFRIPLTVRLQELLGTRHLWHRPGRVLTESGAHLEHPQGTNRSRYRHRAVTVRCDFLSKKTPPSLHSKMTGWSPTTQNVR